MKLLIDTNALLRFLLNDIPQQADQVEAIITHAKKGKLLIIILPIILFEIEYTLRKFYKKQKEEVVEKLESLLSAPFFSIQSKNIFNQAIEIYKQNTISFVDSFFLAQSLTDGIELFTFDKKLQRLFMEQGKK